MFPERLPDRVRDDRSRRAEVRVFDALAASPAGWRVFHSVAWLSRDRAGDLRDGEADFVVVHPSFGLLVIEVKGGGIEVDGRSGQWWSIDAKSEQHGIDDPFAQAAKSKHALIAKVRELPGLRDQWIPVAHCVAFPDLGRLTAPPGMHAPPEIVITGDDLSNLPNRIEEILRHAHSSVTGFGEAEAAEIERLLAPRIRVRAPLAVQAREVDRAILTLTEAQYHVLGLLSRLRRVAVNGPAGSGKSLLAAEQARRLAAQGMKTLFVCFNRPLADALSAELGGSEHLRIHTFHDFCHRMAQEAGLLPDEFVEERPPEFFERLPELLLEALQALPATRFDAVVVDEGQDFETDWWPLVELALADPVEGILYVFHDEAQRVTVGEGSLPAGLAPIVLEENLRNTQAIHTAASAFAQNASMAMGPEGRPVELVEYESGGDLTGALSRVLNRLVRDEQFRPEEIVILSGRGQRSTALAGVERIGAYRCSGLPVMPGAVAVDTIRRFKGLDSRVVILVEIDHLLESPELLYVGITRARAHLVIVAEPATLAVLR